MLVLSIDDLFARCVATSGTDYFDAKSVMVSRPREAEVLAKRILDQKDAPWTDRVLAQALAEEITDPKAYAAARAELIRVAFDRWSLPTSGGKGGFSSQREIGRASCRERV